MKQEIKIKRSALFYMANLYPEIGRMFSYLDASQIEAADNAKIRAIHIVNQILSFEDLKPSGLHEWSLIKNLISSYDKLGVYERRVLEKYAEPFAYKFMIQNYHSNIL